MKRQPPTYILDQQTHESRGSNHHLYVMIFQSYNNWDVQNRYTIEIHHKKHEYLETGDRRQIVETVRILESRYVQVDPESNLRYMITALQHGHGDERILNGYANSIWWSQEIACEKPGLYAQYFPEEYAAFQAQIERQRMSDVKHVMES